MEGYKLRDQVPTANDNENATILERENREHMRAEFFKTYDVMTGVRIAATLGGFFSMMILLVLYKNYCKTSKTLSEEQLNAAVVAAADEEDRALAAALEATAFYTALGEPRRSLGNMSAPLCSPRFSSIGGTYSHFHPPIKFFDQFQRGKSLPGSALRFETRPDTPPRPEIEETDIDKPPPGYSNFGHFLDVPQDRRLSSVTCSSADTSYLERRGSAFEMGLPAAPHFVKSGERVPHEGLWDYYYPIDIQVIQPTPDISPTNSEPTIYEDPQELSQGQHNLQVPTFDFMHRLSVDRSEIGLAPLASISSLASFSSYTSPSCSRKQMTMPNEGFEEENHSQGSDSVFMDEVDTEDEVEQFSTDSEFEFDDDFDDDYSFCENSQKPKRTLKYASIESYDASESIAQEEHLAPQPTRRRLLSRQYSQDIPRQSSVEKRKRKLIKTHSEPRDRKCVKQLPAWTGKGRSGFVPKRQLSSPTKQNSTDYNQQETTVTPVVEERPAFPLPSNSSSSDSPTLTQAPVDNKQGPANLPLTPSLNQRKRLQKQPTLVDKEQKGLKPSVASGLLMPPNITLTSSCEHLVQPSLFEDGLPLLGIPTIAIDVGSCEKLNVVSVEEEQGSSPSC